MGEEREGGEETESLKVKQRDKGVCGGKEVLEKLGYKGKQRQPKTGSNTKL